MIDRELSINSMRANIRWLLNPVKGVDIKPVGSNTVTLKFTHHLDRKHALAGCPWVIERHPLILEPLNPAVQLENHNLVHMPIVVRITQPSLANQSEAIATLIGNSLGRFIEVPKPPPCQYMSLFRIKVTIDVTKPLKRGIFFQGVEGKKEWIQLYYERLPTFCFFCGILRHGEAKCPMRYEDGFVEPEGELPYGSWMRANSETQGVMRGAGLRLIPAEGPVLRDAGKEHRDKAVFSFNASREKTHKDGTLETNENVEPNARVLEVFRPMKPLTISSPSKSINSVASSATKGRKKVVITSNKRKSKEVNMVETCTASKRTQLRLRDEDDLQLTAAAAEQARRDQ